MTDPRIAALPCWFGTPRAAPLAGGLSNEIFRVDDDAGAHVVRFGADYPFHHVSRATEAMAARAAHAAGFAPAVEHTGPGVMVTAFAEGRTLVAADLAADPARFAMLLRRFHTDMPAQVSGTATLFWIFHILRDYDRTLTTGNSPWAEELPRLLNLSAALEAQQIPLPLIFGHQDLLPANLLEGPDGAGGTRLWLIDYEYAAWSTPLFDLASLAAHGAMTPEQSEILLSTYFGEASGVPPESAHDASLKSTTNAPLKRAVDDSLTDAVNAPLRRAFDAPLRRAFDAMTCAALLREAMWGMVSELHLSAPGADYGAYVTENLAALDTAVARFAEKYGRLVP